MDLVSRYYTAIKKPKFSGSCGCNRYCNGSGGIFCLQEYVTIESSMNNKDNLL